jgi:glycosyltransferase involved in cell wall biosynthesis
VRRSATQPDAGPAPLAGVATRSVLMVLYHFPPIGGVSMARNVANVRYLPAHGWTPVVLGARTNGDLIDVEASALVPSAVRVLRARCPDAATLAPAVGFVREMGARWRPSPVAGSDEAPAGPAAGGGPVIDAGVAAAIAKAPSTLGRIRRLLFFPDNQVAWLPFAVVTGVRAARSRRVDAVYSTSSPVTAHLIAGAISRFTGLPWVAEFRDPWAGNPVAEPLPWLHRRLRARLERWIVRSAERLVFLSPSTARAYARRYGAGARIVVVTNGHDRSEAVPVGTSERRPGRYRIVWTGSLYRPSELRLFLVALQQLLARRPTLADELEVAFYGDVESTCRSMADTFLRDPAMASIVHFPGFVPRTDALRAVADADAALVMLGAEPGMGQFVPGKLFDYLGQDKQILAVLPPGDAREILHELDWGVVADPDPDAVERAIERLIGLPPPARPADPDGRYERFGLAGRLAETLDQASGAEAAAEASGSDPPAVRGAA